MIIMVASAHNVAQQYSVTRLKCIEPGVGRLKAVLAFCPDRTSAKAAARYYMH